MLRIRRDLLCQIPGSVRRNGAHQNRFDSQNGSGYRGLHRFQLLDAAPGRHRSRGLAYPHRSPGGSSGGEMKQTTGAPPDTTIQQTIGDPRLQLAIYSATNRLMAHRAGAIREDLLPDYQELRTQANLLKKHTLDHLDYYLELFEAKVAAHGGKVVYCSDSQEVADFVLALAKERKAHLIVKSKSMTTEEIHFNERLEEHQ